MTRASTEADRGVPKMRVLFGTERFSSQHSWSELTAPMPDALQDTVELQSCPPGAFAERARDESIDVADTPTRERIDRGGEQSAIAPSVTRLGSRPDPTSPSPGVQMCSRH
jgi:hypothetical protein